ncbi:MAG: lanthionine synthetase C family protein [Dysgonomonas sp.]
MKNKIELKLHEIAECIFNKAEQQDKLSSLGLYSGEFGVLLFLYHYSRYRNDPRYINIAESYTERLLNVLGDKIYIHTFCDGVSGVLFLFDYLKRMEFINIDISETKGLLEDYIIRGMRNDMKSKNYDFLHGVLGIGYYFLKTKSNNDIVMEVIDYLHATAEINSTTKTAKWESLIDPDAAFRGYNISLAHGMAGIILFLCKSIEQKNQHTRVRELLEQSINYILKQKIDCKEYGSYFPSFSIESSKELCGSRLAWCYGDLGVAYALWYAGHTINNKLWKKTGLDILLQSTRRLSQSESRIIDSGICHGTIGAVIIYRHMYLKTNNICFFDATNYWLKQTLDYAKFKDGFAGYKSHIIDRWANDYSLLTGISGVGLTFISYLNNDQQNWDEIFLL